MLVAGIMSGTSVDGIDVALVELSGREFDLEATLVAAREVSFPPGIRDEVLALCDATVATRRISQLNFLLGRLFGDAVLETCERAGIKPGDLDLVGSHGQTLYHQADPADLCGFEVASTMQIGEPSCIARAVGAPVVADFRPADLAAGGHGAPLVPFADYLLFRDPAVSRVALNIGGIANLTVIPAGCPPAAVLAFDTGPGNMVLDQLVERLSGGRQRYDSGGRIAARGEIDKDLLAGLLEDPYYGRPPPKSTGREQYGAAFVDRLVRTGLPWEALVATAASLTACTILLGIERFARPLMPVDELVVSGGGWHNPAIIEPIREALAPAALRPCSDFGISGGAKEAAAFAVLAYETFHGRPANLPSATGAAGPAILGKITHAPPRRTG